MALRSPALYMGNPAINHTAQNDRLSKAGLLRPETGQTASSRPLTAASGVLAGPAGTMGEVTLLSNTQFTVNPARWYLMSTDTPLGGAYEVTNDAVETIAITAQDATQFRKAYFGVWVIDSFVAGSGDDLPHWGLVNGALAASNPQLPAAGALPENFLALGEFLIPPTGQSVTWTAYNLTTGLRGGIVPVSATDTRLPPYDGASRWHPTQGLQIGRGGIYRRGGAAAPSSLYANENLPAGPAVAINTGPVNAGATGTNGIGPIPAHTPGVLRVKWTGTVVMGTGAPIAGYVQLATNPTNTSVGATVVGTRSRFHNNSSSPQVPFDVDEYIDSDGSARYLFLMGWNDAASANTFSVFAHYIRSWLL